MFNTSDPFRQVQLRFTRRDWLAASCAGIVGLPSMFSGLAQSAVGAVRAAAPATRRAKSVILILLTGGASQQDTFDLKPEAPEGIRGEFRPIDTTVPGLQICEHLPRLASRARQF